MDASLNRGKKPTLLFPFNLLIVLTFPKGLPSLNVLDLPP